MMKLTPFHFVRVAEDASDCLATQRFFSLPRTRMSVRHACAVAFSLSARSANSVRVLSAFFSSVNVRLSTSTARVLPSFFAHALSVPYLEIS